MDKAKELLGAYVNAGADFAEAVKYDIMHNEGMISDETVVKLNKFIIAANALADLPLDLDNETDNTKH